MMRTFGKFAAVAIAAGALSVAAPASAAFFAQVGVSGGTPTINLTNTGGVSTINGSGALKLNTIDSMGNMGSTVDINYTLNGTNNGGASVSTSGGNSFIDQNFNGGFNFTFANSGMFNGQSVNAGDVVFGGNFTAANFRGRLGSTTGSVLSGSITSFTNGALTFQGGSTSNFEFGLAGISPALGGTAAGGINNFSAVLNGKFDNGGTIGVGGIPEPATWGMMMLGFGMLGGALRRRTRTGVVTA